MTAYDYRERFAVLEIATIPLVGPNLRLVPEADPRSGTFAVSFIRDTETDDERRAFALDSNGAGRRSRAGHDSRAARATIAGRFQRVRIDGEVHTVGDEPGWDPDSPITLASAAEPLWFLSPG